MWASITTLSPVDLGPGCTLRRAARRALLAHRLSVEKRMSYKMGHRQSLPPIQVRQGSMDQVDCAEPVSTGKSRAHVLDKFPHLLALGVEYNALVT